MSSRSNMPIRVLNGHNRSAAINDYSFLETGGTYSIGTRKQIKGARRSTTSTSSALALLAFLFFLNMLQRSLDDGKQQGTMVMTRTTTPTPSIIPRKEVTESKKSTAITTSTTRDNILVTKYANIFSKFFK